MNKTKSTKTSRTPAGSANRASGSKSSSKSGGAKTGYRPQKSSSVSSPSKSGGSNRVKSEISSSAGKAQRTSFKTGSSTTNTSGKAKYKVDKGQNTGMMGRLQSAFTRSSGGYTTGGSSRPSILRTGCIIAAVVVVVILIVLFAIILKPRTDAGTATLEPAAQITPTRSASVESSATDAPVDAGAMPVDPVLRNGMYDAPPAMQIDRTKIYNATFVTEKGDIVIELFADKAPNTVNNFVALARAGFYDNTNFHRVLVDFMAQGGDPAGSGMGGPGYNFADEFDPSLKHDSAGTLSMANSGPNTNGSQFFITFAPTPWLDGLHTVFGKVVKGLDGLQSISLRDPETATEPGDTLETIIITESDESLLPTPVPLVYVQPGEIAMPQEPAERDGLYAGFVPAMVIDPAKSYTAVIETENGDIIAELYADLAPNTINNFVFLAREGYYDNTTFHRVIEGFMAQAGDPTGSGSGGPGYAFADEFNGALRHDSAGILSMANAGANTNGSQFFITLDETPWLDGVHTVFGKVIEGFEVLDSISLRDPQTATTPGDVIKTIKIFEE